LLHGAASIFAFKKQELFTEIILKENGLVSYFNVDSHTRLYYTDQGHGQPVIFIHGVWTSSRIFYRQLPYFNERYRTIMLDLRGHGRSTHVQSGHTVTNYSRDVQALMQKLEISNAILVGHSMGALIIWEYFKQFGADNVKAAVIIDQPASDFKWPDWPFGAYDFPALCQMMEKVQIDRSAMVNDLIPFLFKEKPTKENFNLIFEEMTSVPESIAGTIFFNQTVKDYREILPSVTVPTLLCFGDDKRVVGAAAGKYLKEKITGSRLEIFKNCGHCLFLEKPEYFNMILDRFIESLK
jgi:non-heme chloroperoxidase